ncbi:hypothetical protein KP509_24G003900 [Ceratopteris richardii]|nr:hypothetical protein KP509_24G003900 [Ceratopteris richardii]
METHNKRVSMCSKNKTQMNTPLSADNQTSKPSLQVDERLGTTRSICSLATLHRQENSYRHLDSIVDASQGVVSLVHPENPEIEECTAIFSPSIRTLEQPGCLQIYSAKGSASGKIDDRTFPTITDSANKLNNASANDGINIPGSAVQHGVKRKIAIRDFPVVTQKIRVVSENAIKRASILKGDPTQGVSSAVKLIQGDMQANSRQGRREVPKVTADLPASHKISYECNEGDPGESCSGNSLVPHGISCELNERDPQGNEGFCNIQSTWKFVHDDSVTKGRMVKWIDGRAGSPSPLPEVPGSSGCNDAATTSTRSVGPEAVVMVENANLDPFKCELQKSSSLSAPQKVQLGKRTSDAGASVVARALMKRLTRKDISPRSRIMKPANTADPPKEVSGVVEQKIAQVVGEVLIAHQSTSTLLPLDCSLLQDKGGSSKQGDGANNITSCLEKDPDAKGTLNISERVSLAMVKSNTVYSKKEEKEKATGGLVNGSAGRPNTPSKQSSENIHDGISRVQTTEGQPTLRGQLSAVNSNCFLNQEVLHGEIQKEILKQKAGIVPATSLPSESEEEISKQDVKSWSAREFNTDGDGVCLVHDSNSDICQSASSVSENFNKESFHKKHRKRADYDVRTAWSLMHDTCAYEGQGRRGKSSNTGHPNKYGKVESIEKRVDYESKLCHDEVMTKRKPYSTSGIVSLCESASYKGVPRCSMSVKVHHSNLCAVSRLDKERECRWKDSFGTIERDRQWPNGPRDSSRKQTDLILDNSLDFEEQRNWRAATNLGEKQREGRKHSPDFNNNQRAQRTYNQHHSDFPPERNRELRYRKGILSIDHCPDGIECLRSDERMKLFDRRSHIGSSVIDPSSKISTQVGDSKGNEEKCSPKDRTEAMFVRENFSSDSTQSAKAVESAMPVISKRVHHDRICDKQTARFHNRISFKPVSRNSVLQEKATSRTPHLQEHDNSSFHQIPDKRSQVARSGSSCSIQERTAFPSSQVLWVGHFNLVSNSRWSSCYKGLHAYPSTVAHPKVCEALSSLPLELELEQVKREESNDAWQKLFQFSPPTSKNIGAYFTPKDMRSDAWFQSLVHRIYDCGLVLKAVMEFVVLLIFPSHLLPDAEQCWDGRYFLWGVFSSKTSRSSKADLTGDLESSEGGSGEVIDMDVDMVGGNERVSGTWPDYTPPYPPGFAPSVPSPTS